jgi:RNA-dependent RNA polymerase
MIRNVLVTPTRVLIGPPQPEPSNSVTRRYSKSLDGIARVTFTDEEDRLWVSLTTLTNADSLQAGDATKEYDIIRPDIGIMARVRRALQHGVVIGGEKFYPVASSASQQKCVILSRQRHLPD